MCAKKQQEIELPFDIATLAGDLKEIKANLDEAINSGEEYDDEVDLLAGVIENLQQLLPKTNTDKMDRKSKISLIAHFTLLQELVSSIQGDNFDEFEDEEDLDDEE